MQQFIILGPVDPRAVVRTAVFRDAADGNVPGARYFGIDALFRGNRLLTSALTSYRLKARMEKSAALRLLLGGARRAAQRSAQRVTLRRVGGKGAAGSLFVFCPSTHIERISPEMLDDLRRRCLGCRLVFYLIDSVERTARANGVDPDAVIALLDHFDAVYSYAKVDVERYAGHMRFVEIPMWRSDAPAPAGRTAELYFCGRDKGRAELLYSLYNRLTGAGLRCHLRIAGEPSTQESRPGVEWGKWVPYEQIVSDLLQSNCVLDILAVHNNECSLRYKEAVIYNKKLLTNNPNIVNLPYYDARWMRIFRTAEDVDPDWVRAEEPVNYGYRGDYSLETFLRSVDELTVKSN